MHTSPSVDLESILESYEAAQADQGQARLQDHLPSPSHPLYADALRELVRLDLDYGWRRGQPRALEDYRREFPGLFDRRDDLAEIAFEEYRLRQQLGDRPAAEEYALRYGVDVEGWPPPMPPREEALPPPGTIFLGFELLAELGKGSFGRVYLARQADLANRLVVLKVSADIDRECQTLAQLVHTHIVPVYSFHRSPPYQAACMPYLGATTLQHVLVQLGQQADLPRSGRDLVSTLNQRSQQNLPVGFSRMAATVRTTKEDGGGFPVVKTLAEVAPLHTSRVILEMLQGWTYVEAVLWVGSCLADGLAHAHERGIIHRDLKPANILLTEEGQPMILDFNLAEDANARMPDEAAGGTLAYMAPEHLEAFDGGPRKVDARSDLFSLGIILYQLLSRSHPYPAAIQGTQPLPEMLRDRRRRPESLRLTNPDVSPGVEAIVQKCLDPDPDRRYQSARQVHEDLERQRTNLPLRHAANPSRVERVRKWARRHPRMAATGAVSLLASLIIGGLLYGFVWRGLALARADARQTLATFDEAFGHVQFNLTTRTGQQDLLEKGCAEARACLEPYGVLEEEDWERRPNVAHLSTAQAAKLREDVGEALFLLARATARLADTLAPAERSAQDKAALELLERAGRCFDPERTPAVLHRLEADLFLRLGEPERARELRRLADASTVRTPQALFLDGASLAVAGQFRNAIERLDEVLRQEAGHFAAWFVLGYCRDNLGDHVGAVAAFTTAIALRPDFPRTYFTRGVAHLRRRLVTAAEKDFDHYLGLMPDDSDAYLNRAIARVQQPTRTKEALADLEQALKLGTAHTRVYLMLAQIRRKLGDEAGAKADLARGLEKTPNDEAGWVARGYARMSMGDLKQALADFDRVLSRNRWSYEALRNKAYLLAEKQGKLAEAVALLDEALQRYPDAVALRGGRAVYRARLGRAEDAVEDAKRCLQRDTGAAMLYQAACVYSLVARDRDRNHRESLRLFVTALQAGYRDFRQARTDPDLKALRADPEFERLLKAAEALARGSRR